MAIAEGSGGTGQCVVGVSNGYWGESKLSGNPAKERFPRFHLFGSSLASALCGGNAANRTGQADILACSSSVGCRNM